MAAPSVSVVVATCRRPAQVRRAVASALGQSLRDLEVIVVVDGPDPETVRCLDEIGEPRLRVHALEVNGGQAAAINAGVRVARGTWIALLDDDDEWLPAKLETQLRTAEASARPSPVVGCCFVARSDSGDVMWPLRSPQPGEPLCEYLFSRRRLSFGEGVLQTSTMFARAELFRQAPWAEDLRHHCDLDWLVRVSGLPGVGLEMPPERVPLAIWNLRGEDRLSRRPSWRRSYAWIVRSRQAVTRRAYAGFLLTWVGMSARKERDLRAIPVLLAEAVRHGRPGARDVAVFASLWCLPMQARERWSRMLAATAGSGG